MMIIHTIGHCKPTPLSMNHQPPTNAAVPYGRKAGREESLRDLANK